jgi:DnaK suppressor protein
MPSKSKLKRKTPRRSSRVRSRPNRKVASTADILAGMTAAVPKPRKRIASKWSQHYKHLLELRGHLLEQMGKLARQANEEMDRFSMHIADAGTDSFDRDFALSLLSSDQNALYEITEAIKRIEAGSYGVCELTGKPIPRQRLSAIPWTRFSVQAQRQLERDGMIGRPRLAAIGSVEDTLATSRESDDEDEKSEKADL